MSNIQLVENLYRLRKAHHYTQQEISDLLNISRQAYSNYETSKRTPDLDSLIRLSLISMEYLSTSWSIIPVQKTD